MNKNLSKLFMWIIYALYVGFGLEHVKNSFLLSSSCNLFTLARDLFIFYEPVHKRQLIQSQIARILTLKLQFVFDIPNDESYFKLKIKQCRLENLIKLIALTWIINGKIFAFMLFMGLELLSLEVLCFRIAVSTRSNARISCPEVF